MSDTTEQAAAPPTDEPIVLIIDRANGALVARCAGPRPGGVCTGRPGATLADGVCAGATLVPARGTGAEGWRFAVPEGALEECPLNMLVRTYFN